MPGREGLGTKLNKKQIKISVNESLKRLNIDYIDLLQLHWPERYVPLFGSNSYNIKLERSIDDVVSFEEQLLALNDLIQEGILLSLLLLLILVIIIIINSSLSSSSLLSSSPSLYIIINITSFHHYYYHHHHYQYTS